MTHTPWPHIACVADLIRPQEQLGCFPAPLFALVGEPIRQATRQACLAFAPESGLPVQLAPDFDWQRFRALAYGDGHSSWEQLNFDIPPAASDYLADHIPRDSLLLGVEMPAWFRTFCSAHGIAYLDLRISPLRFARDFFVALNTNDAQLHDRIRQYCISREEIALEAAAVVASIHKLQYELRKQGNLHPEADDTLVFVGQTAFDAAIIGPAGRHLTCGDFDERIRTLAASRPLAYKPHPYDPQFARQEHRTLESITGKRIPLCHKNAYQLLGSPTPVALVSISSGLLQEAEFFGKTCHWLHKPLVPLAYPEDARTADHYQQVHFADIIAPAFWHAVLAPDAPPPRLARLPQIGLNHGRELLDTWWDYSKFKQWQRTFHLEAFERSGGAVLRQRVEALERATGQDWTGTAATRSADGHDFSLHSGERQVATRYEDIRADHRYRYEWVDSLLPEGGFGVDVFCGNGYGTWHLSEKRKLWGIDGSADAIRLAEKHYRTRGAFFSQAVYPFDLPEERFDFAVSLESIEHVEDGAGFFATLAASLKPGGLLFFSTPCEEQLPHAKFSDLFHFHHRHYTFEETLRLAESHGLELLDWAGQDVYAFLPDGTPTPLADASAMRLKPRMVGQFLIFFCRKT